jgi:hypothetical protein
VITALVARRGHVGDRRRAESGARAGITDSAVILEARQRGARGRKARISRKDEAIARALPHRRRAF